MSKTFVGFGFGPIQSGLFLYEAQQSGNFGRLVVAEVSAGVIAQLRASRGNCRINVARVDGIDACEVRGVEIVNPGDSSDRDVLIQSIAAADEIATALPSIEFYGKGNLSPAALLAAGIRRKLHDDRLPAAIVYAAENHRFAAEHLKTAVVSFLTSEENDALAHRVQFVNTVIGKMSGLVTDPIQIRDQSLTPFVDGAANAVLVEEFNDILIDSISIRGFRRGIEVFQEKPKLAPFADAKLYGHNATHALLGFLAAKQGLTYMHDADVSTRQFALTAFLEESGKALCSEHAGVDPLFTAAGWTAYAEDLLDRMTNRFLRDRVDRIVRDPLRKLGWHDRIIGTMRLAIRFGIVPWRFAQAAALAIESLKGQQSNECDSAMLNSIWTAEGAPEHERQEIMALVAASSSTDHAR